MPAEELQPFLKKGIHYRIAEVLYRGIFDPIFRLADRISAYFTRSWCEDNSSTLRVMNEDERQAAKRAR